MGATFLDRLVVKVSPERGLRRLKMRAAAELALRRFDGAGHGPRTMGWHSSGSSQNSETYRDLSTLRNRSRELVRNNSWAKKAVGVWTSNATGKGIRPQPIPAGTTKRGLAQADLTLALWEEWAGSTACDADGMHTFYGLQRLVMREIVESGECLVRKRMRRASDGLTIPMQLQVLEADHIDTLKDGPTVQGGRILQGVEFDKIGRRVAYWLFPDHPGEVTFGGLRSFRSRRVPAKEVLHVFDVLRAGQVRGIPWGAPSMLTTRDLDDYVDAELVRNKIASAYTGFVRDLESLEDGLEEADGDDGLNDGVLELQPGTWEELPSGKTIEFSKPPEPGKIGDFAKITLRQIAAGYLVPYEALSGDMSDTNFSSGRIGRLDWRATVEEWQTHGLIPRLCDPVWSWFLDLGIAFGPLSTRIPADWTCPPARLIEPAKEISAWKDAVRSGFTTLSEVIRLQGGNPRRVLEELARDRDLVESLGLNLDSLIEDLAPEPETDPETEPEPSEEKSQSSQD